MILHPLLLAVVLGDLVGLFFLGTAVFQTLGAFDGWRPTSNTPRQLTLERRVEVAGLYTSLALGCFALAGLLLLVAICHHLPPLVPGAMCGTGVLQAAGLLGWRSLGFRGLALVILGAARLICDLNQRTPTAPLAPPLARILLLALPLCGWTLWDTASAFLFLDTHAPVSCCAVVYSQVAPATPVATPLSVLADLPPLPMVGLLAFLSGLILSLLFGERILGKPANLPLLIATAVWLPLAATVLLLHFAAYHFEVLAHHCPWCLFLPEHGLVGYPLLGAFLVMGMEAPVPWLARRLARSYPDCQQAVTQRISKVGIRMTAAMLVFWLVGGLPALIWRLRYGVWMG